MKTPYLSSVATVEIMMLRAILLSRSQANKMQDVSMTRMEAGYTHKVIVFKATTMRPKGMSQDVVLVQPL